jgi:OHCU decarboxylase
VTLEQLNALDTPTAAREFLRCCGSTRWAEKMTAARPFASVDAMLIAADRIWSALAPADWLDAFAAHPRIGERVEREAVAERNWSTQEQSGVATATHRVLDRLATKNRDYESRFGYIFIVCATGKPADDMLTMIEQRLTNDPDRELRIAAEEQRKITRLRLQKLIAEADR